MRFLRRPLKRSEPVPLATDAHVSNPSLMMQLFQGLGPEWWTGLGGMADAVGTVNRCLQLNAQQVATMPLRYRHGDETEGARPAWISDPDPAWYPNGIQDAIFAAVWSIYAHGETFLWVTSRYVTGFPRTWTVLYPGAVSVRHEGGQRVFRVRDRELDPLDVIQVMRNPNDGLRGQSAIQAYWANVSSAFQAETYAANVYSGGGVSRVALKSSARLGRDQAMDLKAQWREAVSSRLGDPAIIPPDLDLLETLSISPKDLMLIESRDWDTRQIAAAFGVPAMLLNVAVDGGLTYQNPAMLADLWWRTELMPQAAKVAAALSRWLPRGNWVEFDPSQILRPDLPTMVSTWSTLLADGVVTPEEYRAAVLDLPPLPEGDQSEELFEEAGAHGAPEPEPTPARLEAVT